jgi:hypothetical protein
MTEQDKELRDMIIKMSTQIEEIYRRIKCVPDRCIQSETRLKQIEDGIQNVWKSLDSKASWAAIVVILGVYSALIVAALRTIH